MKVVLVFSFLIIVEYLYNLLMKETDSTSMELCANLLSIENVKTFYQMQLHARFSGVLR